MLDEFEQALTAWLVQNAYGLGLMAERHVIAKESASSMMPYGLGQVTRLRFERRPRTGTLAVSWILNRPLPSYFNDELLMSFEFNADGLRSVKKHLKDTLPDVPYLNDVRVCDYKLVESCRGLENGADVCTETVDHFWICDACAAAIAKPRPNSAGFVYIVGNSTYHFYKIGKAKDVQERNRTISIQLPFDIRLVHSIAADDNHAAERKLHTLLARHRARGEWFVLDSKLLDSLQAAKHFENGTFLDIDGNPVSLDSLV